MTYGKFSFMVIAIATALECLLLHLFHLHANFWVDMVIWTPAYFAGRIVGEYDAKHRQ